MKINKKTILVGLTSVALAITSSAQVENTPQLNSDFNNCQDADPHANCGVKIGPNGGRILKKTGVEFYITEKGQVKIYFLDDKGKTTEPNIESIRFVIGADLIELKKDGKAYVSVAIKNKLKGKAALKIKANGKSATDKFKISLEKCGDCKNPEYKCVCHHH